VNATSSKLLLIGRITAARGLRGELVVFSYTSPVTNLLQYDEFILRKNCCDQKFSLISGFAHGKKLVIKLTNIIDRNMAENLVGSQIYLDSAKLAHLEDDELYWYQLEGLQVITSAGNRKSNRNWCK